MGWGGVLSACSSADYLYQTLRCNVDMLKIIQLGLTFSDESGNVPVGVCTWQLNFQFNLKYGDRDAVSGREQGRADALARFLRVDGGGRGLSDDMFAQESIDMLQKSGIDFQKHAQYGIDVQHFGELLISSGFVLNDAVKWIAFHGCACRRRSRRRRGGQAALTLG